LSAVAFLVLVRYRSLVPFMFMVPLCEHVIRRVIFVVLPMPRLGSPPGFWINVALLGLMVVGLVLSLWRPAGHDPLRASEA
jgi:hypothetical protein